MFRIDMLNEATRDFLSPFVGLYFVGPPEKTINNEIRKFTLPRYMPAFEKVQNISVSGGKYTLFKSIIERPLINEFLHHLYYL